MRRTFLNPYFNHAEDRPLSPAPNSKLPMDHPDFSPSSHCPPKLLFPASRRSAANRNKNTRNPTSKIDGNDSKEVERSTSQSASEEEHLDSDEEGDEDEDEWIEIKPLRLNFADSDAKTAGPSKLKAAEAEKRALSLSEEDEDDQEFAVQEGKEGVESDAP